MTEVIVQSRAAQSPAMASPARPAATGGLPLRQPGFAAFTAYTEAWLANQRLSEHTRAAYRRGGAPFPSRGAPPQGGPPRALFPGVNPLPPGPGAPPGRPTRPPPPPAPPGPPPA